VRNTAGRRAFLVAALAAAIGGCSAIGGSKEATTYDLTAPQYFPQAVRARAQLAVHDATAVGPLDSDKIIVRPSEGSLAALGGLQWSERLPRLVQAKMVQTFENARRMQGVGRAGDRIVADYQLLLDIRNFEIVPGNTPVAEVTIAAKIVGDRSGRVVNGRVFHARVPAAATEGPKAVDALDEAWSKVAVDIVLWASRII
jgi:cholesterol transport system auxiliary component